MCESSHTNYRYLNHNEKSQRMANLQRKKQESMKKLAYWSSRIREEIHENGLSVDDEQQAYFQETITLPNVEPPFDEETPQWLLWEQQKLQASKACYVQESCYVLLKFFKRRQGVLYY